jgi:hypothetical protein
MSQTNEETHCIERASGAIERIVTARPRDLGGFSVRRLLPAPRRPAVGPFVFFDHLGPAYLAPGAGISVRPHPHIALSTVTYLFDGEIFHRDSLGSAQAIRPGEVNWMRAGRGIVHSERTTPERLASGQHIHGIQAWVALPQAHEEDPPAFFHHPSHELPTRQTDGATLRIIAGHFAGLASPVAVSSPLFYVDAALQASAPLEMLSEHEERAFYVASGAVSCEGEDFPEGSLVILRPGAGVCVRAHVESRLMLLGGAPLDGPRLLWWNFVSSRRERIEEAKRDWRERRFPVVPGDEDEFIPLPES